MSIEHDPDFLALARAILEGKEPPKKGEGGDKEKKASEVLDRVKKDVGASDDGSSKKGDGDKETDKDPDQTDDPDKDPDQGSGDDGEKPGFKKKPKKLDKSKDPFKDDGKPAADKGDDSTDTDTDPKDPEKDPGKGDSPVKDDDPDKSAGAEEKEGTEDDSENDADGAGDPKKGKKPGFGDDKSGDAKDGESEGEVIDGSSESKINITPKIEDEEISESYRDRAMARALGLVEKHIGFKKLEGELAHEKGVTNPAGLAAAIGRKKYGKKRFQKMSEGSGELEEDSASFDSVGHHSKLFRYHDQQSRRIQRHLDSGENWNRDPDFTGESEKTMRGRKAYHDTRCAHHASALATERNQD